MCREKGFRRKGTRRFSWWRKKEGGFPSSLTDFFFDLANGGADTRKKGPNDVRTLFVARSGLVFVVGGGGEKDTLDLRPLELICPTKAERSLILKAKINALFA